jgi:DNA-binding transcriptional LysR family regulator
LCSLSALSYDQANIALLCGDIRSCMIGAKWISGTCACSPRWPKSCISGARQIGSTRHKVGARLVDRSAHRVALTAAGRAFLAEALEALSAADRAIRAARGVRARGIERLRLGLTIGAAQPQVGHLLARVRASHPAISFEIHEVEEADIGRVLSDGTVDAVVAWDRSVPGGLHVQPLMQVAMRVAVPEGHSLAARSAVALEEMDGQSLILPARARQPVLHETYRAHCAEAGIAMAHVAEVATTADMMTLVAGGIGIAHAPLPPGLAWPGVVILPQSPPMMLGFDLVWARVTDAVEALLAAAEQGPS